MNTPGWFRCLLVLASLFAGMIFDPTHTLAQSAPPAPQRDGKGLEGSWQGALTVNGGIQLRLVMHATPAAAGGFTGTLDSVDQGAMGIPMDTLTQSGDAVHFEMKKIGASFDGTLNAERTSIQGTFRQGPGTLPLTFERTDKPLVIARPQEPKRPFPYAEEEVTFPSTAAGVTLAGTFTRPSAAGRYPAVLLVTGSGPQNRDEELLGHKPFLVIADYLTRRGDAVLRVDDRGVGKSTGNFGAATSEDFAADALGGVAYLKTRPDVDPAHVGLVGHSEGGLIAPLVASRSRDVAFVVLLAGPGVPGDEILVEQSILIGKTLGKVPDEARKREELRAVYAILKEEKDPAAAERRLRALRDEQLAKATEAERADAAKQAAEYETFLKQVLSPWFRFFITYDPKPALSKLTCPVLALNGELDLQVPPRQNLPAISAALEAGANRDYEVVKLPGLNHLFQSTKTGAPAEYAAIEETFSPAALDLIGEWILRHATAAK